MRKVVTVILVMLLCLNGVNTMTLTIHANEVVANQQVEHPLEPGDSPEGNPLKGFIPYDELTTGTTTEFPHSLEWFYVPVKAIQSDMNTFDWEELEIRLNAVASRGHQAVFRLYYDYPGLESGVPDFLVDNGITMRAYDEPDNLGGGGLTPDYNDETFRASMQTLIADFGLRYDGDPRIGYITLGLLGFWGEWHTWPYDEDTSDDREDWSIQTEVFEEVLQAFDEAFDVTGLCVREPKWGIDYTGVDIGFHDDSFAYATVSAEEGGQDWSFMSKMYSFELGDKWLTHCIGGELYPPTQSQIFETEDWVSETGQTFEKSLEQTHASWLINEDIKNYVGAEREAARQASALLGYEFRVESATFIDGLINHPLEVSVAIINQGNAPFYYDHTTWPIVLSVWSGDKMVDQWTTPWDLNTIPVGDAAVSFDFATDWEGDEGEYSLALKVMNPLSNGAVLKFANKEQGEDGWLSLGEFTVVNTNNIQEEKDNGAPSDNEGDASKEADASKAEVDRQPTAVWIGLVILLIAIVTGSLVYNRKRSK